MMTDESNVRNKNLSFILCITTTYKVCVTFSYLFTLNYHLVNWMRIRKCQQVIVRFISFSYMSLFSVQKYLFPSRQSFLY